MLKSIGGRDTLKFSGLAGLAVALYRLTKAYLTDPKAPPDDATQLRLVPYRAFASGAVASLALLLGIPRHPHKRLSDDSSTRDPS